ncbi:MAG: UbiA family prenyltransferase [Thermotogae bacterium]|nr:UbiA family prenyltransferase [Thermotogota bacterium]
MIKPFQTLMLIFTGVVGYLTAASFNFSQLLNLIGSMFLTISGATLLNMWYDADIDALMSRTKGRPIPAGRVPKGEVLVVGLLLSLAGLIWAFAMSHLYGIVSALGFTFNVVVYTVWTKRRTPWSILWGGIAGAMPILGGRVLATGAVDALGLLMASVVLFWIPIHNIPFEVRYREDYRRAGVPVLPNVYGVKFSMVLVPIFVVLSYVLMLLCASLLEAPPLTFIVITLAFIFFFAISLLNVQHPDDHRAFILFKLASSYMFLSMVAMLLA